MTSIPNSALKYLPPEVIEEKKRSRRNRTVAVICVGVLAIALLALTVGVVLHFLLETVQQLVVYLSHWRHCIYLHYSSTTEQPDFYHNSSERQSQPYNNYGPDIIHNASTRHLCHAILHSVNEYHHSGLQH
nr:hypothetical protein BaRGS_021224 [Batillaria attramentaria]